MPKLEDWSILDDFYAQNFMEPKFEKGIFCGVVEDHDEIDDGKAVFTSPIISFDWGKKAAVTRSGTVYYLGKPQRSFLDHVVKLGKTLLDYDFPRR